MWDVEPGSREAIVRVIRTVAPDTKRLGGIRLPDCGLGDDELRQLLEELHQSGIRTHDADRTLCKREADGQVWLRLTDAPPGVGRQSITMAVDQILAHLQSIDDEVFEAEWPELQNAMYHARASARDWQDAMLCRPWEARLAIKAAKFTGREFMIKTGRDLAAVALMLPHNGKLNVTVNSSLEVLDSPAWQQIALHHHGELNLKFPFFDDYCGHPDPCDDLLPPLVGSRYNQISIMEPELLEVEEQRRLLALLHESGVRTDGSGVTRIMCGYDDDIRLMITDEPPPASDLDPSIKNDGCCLC
ncbi:uncharacterized protein LOC108673089 [Hyalella azteca]|uniref:Uncharacterized protein LOC108673089 n=1 Tax=Hyalella azteca TaxID=294128 RepID=A0A979FQK0_HYAAZ|nr:uncharacterized protein LOC108673089 [Hyalella azteca]